MTRHENCRCTPTFTCRWCLEEAAIPRPKSETIIYVETVSTTTRKYELPVNTRWSPPDTPDDRYLIDIIDGEEEFRTHCRIIRHKKESK